MSLANSEPVLTVTRMTVRYGGVTAVDHLDFELHLGEIVAMIGANGAGKSSTLMALSGLAPASGSIRFLGEDISNLPPEERVRRGIIQVPEGRRIFARLTVLENLRLGAYLQSDKRLNEQTLDEVLSLFPILRDRRHQAGGTLSGGEQQMLAIARGVMAHPKLLLLDEPSLGLSPIFAQKVFDTITQLAGSGRAVLLVEQNARAALKISNRAYCLETGRMFLDGDSRQLANDPRVKEAYLGG